MRELSLSLQGVLVESTITLYDRNSVHLHKDVSIFMQFNNNI